MTAFDLQPDEPGFQFRPCPFCGSTNIGRAERFGYPTWASCNDCDAEGPVKLTGREADAAWNKREAQP